MEHYFQLASMIYYGGAGVVLLGTGIRFIYRLAKDFSDDRELLDDLREQHLPNIYGALKAIAKKLDVDLEIDTRL